MCRRTILRYHGGKWKLADWIIGNLPKHRTYVEPFGGAASVLLRKPRSQAEIYNDLDGELVNLFRVARESGPQLVKILKLTPYARSEFKLSYIPTDDPIEQARRTVVRSFLGFGSNSHNKATGFRSNSRLSGTSPGQDWRNYPDALEQIIDRLQGVVIENRPALDIIAAHDSEKTAFYIDPPYLSATRDRGNDYRFEMTDSEHIALSEELAKLKGMVVLSGYNNDLYEQLYYDWRKVE